MSWGETLKALNKDPNKSLDTLLKEQFNSNNSNVSSMKSDIAYIKNTQLGTNLNNLLNGSSNSTIDFNNKPLVDKINYLLLFNGNTTLGPNGTNIFASRIPLLTLKSGASVACENILSYTPTHNGTVKLITQLSYGTSYHAESGIYMGKTSNSFYDNQASLLIQVPNSSSLVEKSVNITVKKGETIYFFLGQKGPTYGNSGAKCQNFKIMGGVVFQM